MKNALQTGTIDKHRPLRLCNSELLGQCCARGAGAVEVWTIYQFTMSMTIAELSEFNDVTKTTRGGDRDKEGTGLIPKWIY